MTDEADIQAEALLREAMAAHGGGRLDAADDLYRKVLALRPRDHNALANLGGVLLMRGRLEEGLDAIDASLAVKPEQPAVLGNKAEALRLLGRTNESVAALEEAGRHDPGQMARLGDFLCHLDRSAEGVAAYDRALAADPGLFAAWRGRGLAQQHLGRLEPALRDLAAALALRPDDLGLQCTRAEVLAGLDRFAEAVAGMRSVLERDPAMPAVWANLAACELRLGRPPEALNAADRALALEPERADAWFHRGGALRALGRTEEALAACERAAALLPTAVTWNDVGRLLFDLARYDEARAAYDRALAIGPDQPEPNWNKSLLCLLRQDYAEGWRLQEWRKRLPGEDGREFLQPGWLERANLAGKTLLVRAEQGFGDTLQMLRYLPLLADRGTRVALEVPAGLAALTRTMPGVSQVTLHDEPPPPHDFSVAIMSLPLGFDTTVETIAGEPYLHADPAKAAAWARRLGQRTRPRVGLVWSGGARPGQLELAGVNARRNIALAQLEPLAQAEVDFYSLQKGQPAESELAALVAAGWSGPRIIDLTGELHDFSDTAALIENLDLVISVDTSTAHLAGAMGRPVWILNRFDTCWRWMLERSDSPWYPSARLFRQTAAGGWGPVVAEVMQALKALAAD